MIIIFDMIDSVGVKPKDIPVVARAEITSNITELDDAAGLFFSIINISMVEAMQSIIAEKTIFKHFLITLFGMHFFLSITSPFALVFLIAATSKT